MFFLKTGERGGARRGRGGGGGGGGEVAAEPCRALYHFEIGPFRVVFHLRIVI